jgi:hypothetical protein
MFSEAWAAIIGGTVTGSFAIAILWVTLQDSRRARKEEAEERRRDRLASSQLETLTSLREALVRLFRATQHLGHVHFDHAGGNGPRFDGVKRSLGRFCVAEGRALALVASVRDDRARYYGLECIRMLVNTKMKWGACCCGNPRRASISSRRHLTRPSSDCGLAISKPRPASVN